MVESSIESMGHNGGKLGGDEAGNRREVARRSLQTRSAH